MEEIVKLVKDGVVQYPITKPEAVIDEGGVSLNQKIALRNVAAEPLGGGDAMRQVLDAKDLTTNEKIYFKGHAKATYMSDGRNVEEAINEVDSEIRKEIASKVDATYVSNAINNALGTIINGDY